MKRKVLLFLAAQLLPAAACAYDACIDGIYYNIVKKARQATVTYRDQDTWGGATFYSGNVVIPETIEYEGVVCNVVAIDKKTFYDCGNLTSISIPSTVTSIGTMAFDGSHWTPHLTGVYITDLTNYCKMVISSNPLAISDHFYVNGIEIRDLEIPNGIVKIKAGTFRGAKMLTSVKIPDSVTEIESRAFSGCSSMKSINIPESITSIPARTFRESGITSIVIPNSVTEIGADAFYNCANLKTVTFGTGVKTVDYCAFLAANSLESVYIFDLAAWMQINFSAPWGGDVVSSWAVTHVSGGSNPLMYAKHFYLNGKEVKDLVIPEGVTKVNASSFPDFIGLTSATIPDWVESCSFKGCSSMEWIKVGNGTQSFVIKDCERLTSVSIGSGTETISISSCPALKILKASVATTSIDVSRCNTLETLIMDIRTQRCSVYNCKELTDVYCAAASVPKASFSEDCQVNYATLHVLGEFIEQYRTADGWKDFGTIVAMQPGDPGYFKPDMTPINFADATVKSICVGKWDFNKDGEISVFEVSQVKDLGSAFYEKDITSFNELKYFTSIKSVNFSNCTSLTSVVIPDGVTSLNFNGCSSLTSINIPSSVTSIERETFYGCSGLTSVTIPNSVTSISYYAFYRCSGLTSVTIPNSVTIIGSYAFYDCSSLTSVTIPNSVTSIGSGAFSGCI